MYILLYSFYALYNICINAQIHKKKYRAKRQAVRTQ